jgi:hypothetical protein
MTVIGPVSHALVEEASVLHRQPRDGEARRPCGWIRLLVNA